VRQQIVACTLCPRLRRYCEQVATTRKAAHRDETYWGKPVPGFGDPLARVLVIGLAPAAHGANRTGRVFTGDAPGGSADFLMRAMHRHGFANIPTSRHPDDGLRLIDAYIAAVVRCAPPQNKPTPEEVAKCLPHLTSELAALPNVRVVVALGRIAFDAYLRMVKAQGERLTRRPAFAHGAAFVLGDGLPTLIASYHPSRQNTNTRKLTPRMMGAVFRKARSMIR
jgi:uracil-DNA glycosylase family 4